ncbi:hypothetical protein HYV86_02945 [Candidatus Woesearchaeota archaeon]|nr:hypothetical protein [Candidatus Woesearchaeota archaeon]
MPSEPTLRHSTPASPQEQAHFLMELVRESEAKEEELLEELDTEIQTVKHLHKLLQILKREVEELEKLEEEYNLHYRQLEELFSHPSLGRNKVDSVMEKIQTYSYLMERKIRVLLPQVQHFYPITADELAQQKTHQAKIDKFARSASTIEETLNAIFRHLQETSPQAQAMYQQLTQRTKIGF